jgi:hypothetical protein
MIKKIYSLAGLTPRLSPIPNSTERIYKETPDSKGGICFQLNKIGLVINDILKDEVGKQIFRKGQDW